MGCANNAQDTKVPVSKETKNTPPKAAVVELDIDQLMQQIDEETAELSPKESDITIQEVNECNVKDYKGLKKYVFCFAGGKKAQEGIFYYKEGKAIAAIYTLEQYNASPANLAAFDEAKTVKKQVKLYFKDGNLNNFDQVLDQNNQAVILDEAQSKEWEILTAALQ